jgi:PAS domain S-box-containing protein
MNKTKNKRPALSIIRKSTSPNQRAQQSNRSDQSDFVDYTAMINGLMKVCSETETILCLDTSGVIVNINASAARRFGKNVSELIGQHIWNILPPAVARRRRKIFNKVITSGSFARFEDERDNRWIDSITYPILNMNGKVVMVLVIGHDITDQRRHTEHIETLNRELEQRVAERTAQLELKTKDLQDMNTALRVILRQRENDREELKEEIFQLIENLVIPTLKELHGSGLTSIQKRYVARMKSNLNAIFYRRVSSLTKGLPGVTPQQNQIATMICDGKSTKEIADSMNLSVRTVEAHREHIRKKFAISNRKTSLRAYLLSLR